VCSRRIKKNGKQEEQALGRSRGGFSTKIHLLAEGLGNLLQFTLTGGQRHDITQAEALLESHEFEHVIADTAYDADWLLDLIAAMSAIAVIPPRSNRTEPRDYDKHLYKERHLVECFINKLKWYRRVFTRYEKLAQRYAAFVHFAAALIWLR
jgi:transposase